MTKKHLKKRKELSVAKRKPKKPSPTHKFLRVIFGDVRESEKRLNHRDDGFNRRAVVRTMASAIDATIWMLKQQALAQEYLIVEFTDAEKAILREESYDTADGKVITRTRFIRASDNIKFVLKSYSPFISTDEINFRSNGWDCMLSLLKTRNRIVHPKTLSDLFISDEDLESAKAAFHWFSNTLLGLADSVSVFVMNKQAETKRRLDELPIAYWDDEFDFDTVSNPNQDIIEPE